MRYLLVLALLSLAGCGESDTLAEAHGGSAAAAEAGISVYFSPQTDCHRLIINHIRMAQKSISVQAYSFTSETIAKALVEAHKRGVKVTVVLDAEKAEKSEGAWMAKRGIGTYIDTRHEKAHSKIILIDDATVITGSFNFSDDRADEVSDNVVVITGKPKLAAAYVENFDRHLKHSKPL